MSDSALATNINTGYMANEQRFIKEAINLGYRDPHSSDQNEILFIDSSNKTYRRYIVGFEMVAHPNIHQSQIREAIVDKDYCRDDLIPRIKKDGGILDPIWVTIKSRIKDSLVVTLDHGHHRQYSDRIINEGKTLMPCFILSDFVFEIDKSGSPVGLMLRANFLLIKSKINCNPPANNLIYNYKDIPHQLADLYKADPTFNGINPSRSFPERRCNDNIFDRMMDDLHPNAFLNTSTRTKIFNLWARGNSTSKTNNIGFSDITNDLVSCSFDAGVTKTSKGTICRTRFLDWHDSKNKVYLGVTNTNAKGATFERDFALPLIKLAADGTIDNKQQYEIVIHCTIYKPPATLVAIKKQRQDFVQLLTIWNQRFINLGYINIKFKEVIFPKQLTDPNDQRTQIKI